MGIDKLVLLICVASSVLTLSLADTFDVTQYGAVGDGETDDTQKLIREPPITIDRLARKHGMLLVKQEAFKKAWDATCKSEGNPTLNIPGGKTFFLNPQSFVGPCTSSITIQIDGDIIAPGSRDAWTNCEDNTWIVFRDVNGLTIQGKGSLDGKGKPWWPERADTPAAGACSKPTAFRLSNCSTTQVKGIKLLNSGGRHLSISSCNDVSVNKITITVPEDSRNTDGINISGSERVQIRDSNIMTGDDCIAIGNKCFNVNISGIACGPGHGISVGSLGKNDEAVAVDGIFVDHCNFTRTEFSARIKTIPGASGFAKNIFYDHIILNGVKSAIEINQNYEDKAQQKNGGVEVKEIHFTNVQGTGHIILLDGDAQTPCQKIFLQNVNVAPSSGQQLNVTCRHANVKVSAVSPHLSCTN